MTSGPYAPWSPCGPGCLPDESALPRVSALRVAARLAVLLAVVVATAVGIMLSPALGARVRLLRRCCGVALRLAGIRVRRCGPDRYGDGVLVAVNHLSWIDALALTSVQPVRMLAKREVRDWPLFGALAARCGALFVDRAALRRLPAVVGRLAATLRAGGAVVVFPEGTTWCGAASGPFRPAAFQAALDGGAPVRPVAIRLRLPDGQPGTAGVFVGEDTLWESLRRVLRLPALICEIDVLPAAAPAAGRTPPCSRRTRRAHRPTREPVGEQHHGLPSAGPAGAAPGRRRVAVPRGTSATSLD